MKLFKKCTLALMALLMAGYLVSCKNNNDPSPAAEEVHYEVYAQDSNDVIQYLCLITESELNEGLPWFEANNATDSYTIDEENHKIILTEDGFIVFLGLCNAQLDHWAQPYAFIVSDEKYWVFDQELYEFLTDSFTPITDYSEPSEYKIVVLTDDGYAKMNDLFNDYWYNLFYNPTGETNSLYLYTITTNKFAEGTSGTNGLKTPADYTIEDHVITLTNQGLIKFLTIAYKDRDFPYAIITYDNEGIINDFSNENTMNTTAAAANLIADEDYKLFNEQNIKIVDLTSSGYNKIKQLWNSHQ